MSFGLITNWITPVLKPPNFGSTLTWLGVMSVHVPTMSALFAVGHGETVCGALPPLPPVPAPALPHCPRRLLRLLCPWRHRRPVFRRFHSLHCSQGLPIHPRRLQCRFSLPPVPELPLLAKSPPAPDGVPSSRGRTAAGEDETQRSLRTTGANKEQSHASSRLRTRSNADSRCNLNPSVALGFLFDTLRSLLLYFYSCLSAAFCEASCGIRAA